MLSEIILVALLVGLSMAVAYVRSAPLLREGGEGEKGGIGFTVLAFIVMGGVVLFSVF